MSWTSSSYRSAAKQGIPEVFNPFGWRLQRLSPADSSYRHPYHPGWPEVTSTVLLPDNERFPRGLRVRLRPLVATDKGAWRTQSSADDSYLRPVEPAARGTRKEAQPESSGRSHIHYPGTSAGSGLVVAVVIEVNGEFAGHSTLGSIPHGAISDCWSGYWVYSKNTG